MKRSEELLGLSVISIEDGKELGNVNDLLINSEKGTVQYLVMDNGLRYLGIKVLPFKVVEGVGEDAVTIQNDSCIVDLNDEPEITGLLEKNVRVKGTKVLTKKGKMVGTVSEFMVDEENDGRIEACEMTPVNENGSIEKISSDQIITFGKDVLIVNEAAESTVVSEKDSESGTDLQEDTSSANEAKGSEEYGSQETEQSQAAKLFEERQRKYLLGRKASKRIEADNGEVIAEEGDVVTEELMDKAKSAGKFSELSMNTNT